MKVVIFILLIFETLSAQKKVGSNELFFYQDGDNFVPFTYNLTPIVRVVWDNSGQKWMYDNYGTSVFSPLPLNLIGYIGSPTGEQNSNGMDYILSGGDGYPEFGNSLYKVTCKINYIIEASFYLDIRDCNYPNINSEYAYNDFTIKYINSEKKFYIANGKGVPFNSSLFKEVTNKLVALWEVEGIVGPNVNCFDNYWTNCLGITDYYNFPRLI